MNNVSDNTSWLLHHRRFFFVNEIINLPCSNLFVVFLDIESFFTNILYEESIELAVDISLLRRGSCYWTPVKEKYGIGSAGERKGERGGVKALL